MAAPKGRGEVAKKANALETLKIEYVPVGSLQPNDYNPNRQSDHDFELLLRSMREDGFTQPIVALRSTKVIVDGEHRWRAGQALGMAEVPVVFVDMTPEQARIATLRHNRARGSEDVELAAAVLRDLAALGALDYAQDQLMLDDEEISRLMEDMGAPDALASEDFGQAWEPAATTEDGRESRDELVQSEETVTTAAPGGGLQAQSMSAAAIEANRVRERQLAAARTQEERDSVMREAASFYRLTLLFQGEEAQLVQRCLGSRAAEKLIEVLREYEAANPEAVQATEARTDADASADEQAQEQ